jgi:glutathione synthase/RimK-type ligase-like ATP-grasp enzyme
VPLIGLVTCAELPAGEEAPLLDAALQAHGIEPVWAVWDDPAVDWSRFELVVVRSAWDYAERSPEFLRWAEARPRIENTLPVLRFGVDKERYLAALAAAGVPVVPTVFVRPGGVFRPPIEPFVVKPAISAGGRRSARFEPEDDAARALVSEINAAGQTAMIQPLLSGVAESSLVYLGGAYSHSLSRRAELPSRRAQDVLYLEEELGPYEATSEERRIAAAALELAPEPLLYARVDLLGGLVLELELVEPSLYLSHGDGSAGRLAAAVVSRLEARLSA